MIDVFLFFGLLIDFVLGWFGFVSGEFHYYLMMNRVPYGFVLSLVASVLFACGGLCMKYSQGLTRLDASMGVFGFFCIGAALQAVAMRRAEMGVIYLLVLGLEAVAAFGISIFVLGERVTASKLAALFLIVFGIVLLNRG